MKKLLKFGIVSLSLTVLAGAGLVAEPMVYADTDVVPFYDRPEEGEMVDFRVYHMTHDWSDRILDETVQALYGSSITVQSKEFEGYKYVGWILEESGKGGGGPVASGESTEVEIDGVYPLRFVRFIYELIGSEDAQGDVNVIGDDIPDTPPIDNGGGDVDNQTPPKDDGAVTDTPTPEPQPEAPKEDQTPPAPETPAPKVLTDQDLATFAEVARLYDEVIALGGKPWDQLHHIAEIAKSGDKGRMTSVLNSYENIRGFVTRLESQLAELKKTPETPAPTPAPKDLAVDRNKLLLSVDESGLTDQQKGELAIKITFAETEKDLADLKAELVKLVKVAEKPANKPAKEAPKTESKAPAAAAKPAANAPAKSDKAALPATGDVTRVGLIAAGFSLLLLGLGLSKFSKHS